MSITPEVSAKTLTQLVATEVKVQMARADVRQSQLAREIGKTEQWLSVRLRGRQPIDINDLALIAKGLNVGIHDLLPPPAEAARATTGPLITTRYSMPALQAANKARPRDNRPTGQRAATAPAEGARTAYLTRPARGRRDR